MWHFSCHFSIKCPLTYVRGRRIKAQETLDKSLWQINFCINLSSTTTRYLNTQVCISKRLLFENFVVLVFQEECLSFKQSLFTENCFSHMSHVFSPSYKVIIVRANFRISIFY